MLEGNLSDVSLPGLLQFLATESNKSYKVSLINGGQKGDLLVCAGDILSANYGLLEGNDALTELLFWPEGSFTVAILDPSDKDALKGNLKIPLKQVNTFADQMAFLREATVGLNSEIVPSLSFGTQAWQEALARQPLSKEDYAVLGWITDGRTMRQAMREFNFDVVRATSSLFRLLVTGSVEILRPTLIADDDRGQTPLTGLAAILDSMQPSDDAGATFDASPQAADLIGDSDIAKGEMVGNAMQPTATTQMETTDQAPEPLSSAIPAPAVVPEVIAEAKALSKVESSAERPDQTESAPAPQPEVKTEARAEVKTEAKTEPLTETKVENKAAAKVEARTETKQAGKDKSEIKPHSPPEPAPVAASRLVKNIEIPEQSSVGTATGATFNAVGGTMELSPAPAAPAAPAAPMPVNTNGDRDVITCDSLPAVGSAEFNEIMAKAQKASEQPVDHQAPLSQDVTTQIHLPTSFRTSSDKIPAIGAPLAPESLPSAAALAMARKSIEIELPAAALSTANLPAAAANQNPAPVASSLPNTKAPSDSSNAWSAAVREDSRSAAPAEESPEKRLFDIVRTDPLPIVAIDIERLFQTSFHVSPFGHISLGNDVLEADLQKILRDFKMGKNFITVATEEHMLPAQVLHYCKYCLERGYIDPPDAVASLTADLLLDRVELEQYLLQRRRITGDELRDVQEVARKKGIKLTDLLVKLGFMTASDWDRLCQEKERFARR